MPSPRLPSIPSAFGTDPLHPERPALRIVGSISGDPTVSPPPGAALVPIVDVTNKNTTVDDLRRATARTITQGSHGFTAGTALFNNNGTWTKAKADSLTTARVDGVVSGQSLAAGSFLMVSGGAIGGLSWTPNTQYYLSDATAGLLTTTPPTALTSFLVPVARGNTASEATVQIGAPLSLAKIPDSALENPGGGDTGGTGVETGIVAMFPRSGLTAGYIPAGWTECNGANGTTDEADIGAMAVIMKHGGAVATPTFDLPAGSYTGTQTVTISCATSLAQIRYTTDGSLPSRTVGLVYSAPVSIPATATLKAIAYRSAVNPALTMVDSAIQSAVYTISAAPPDTTAPTLTNAIIPPLGNTLMLFFTEVVVVGGSGSSGVTLVMSGGPVTVVSASGAGTNNINYALSRVIAVGETGTVSYAQPGNGIEDGAGNDVASFSGVAITNNSTQTGGADTTPPTVTSAVIPAGAPNTLQFNCSENVVVGSSGAAGVTLAMSGGAVTTTSIAGAGTAMLTYTLSRAIAAGETGTVAYTQPGDGIKDTPAGWLMASFSGMAVTNNVGGGGGTPGWVYSHTMAEVDGAGGFDEFSTEWQKITASYTGNVDKLSVCQQYVNSAGRSIKGALYSGDGTTILGSGIFTSTGTGADVDVEIPLGAPVAVVAGQSYWVGWSYSDALLGQVRLNYTGVVGNSGISYSFTYATFPQAPVVVVGTTKYRVGLHQI